jgi:hypothetical protein
MGWRVKVNWKKERKKKNHSHGSCSMRTCSRRIFVTMIHSLSSKVGTGWSSSGPFPYNALHCSYVFLCSFLIVRVNVFFTRLVWAVLYSSRRACVRQIGACMCARCTRVPLLRVENMSYGAWNRLPGLSWVFFFSTRLFIYFSGQGCGMLTTLDVKDRSKRAYGCEEPSGTVSVKETRTRTRTSATFEISKRNVFIVGGTEQDNDGIISMRHGHGRVMLFVLAAVCTSCKINVCGYVSGTPYGVHDASPKHYREVDFVWRWTRGNRFGLVVRQNCAMFRRYDIKSITINDGKNPDSLRFENQDFSKFEIQILP